jgi:proteasome accessory factor C
MSAAGAVARMLTLIPWLLQRPGASLVETAAAFGVDVPTVRRDLEHLDFCGLPGLGGGALFDVSIVGDRVVVQMADELRRPLRPTATEALRLVLLVDAATVVLGDEVPELTSALAKLRRALGIPEHVADVLDGERPTSVEPLRDAARRGVRVTFRYQRRGDDAPTSRSVEPWAVHLLEGAWYLHGWDVDRQGPRTFRLDRASDVLVTDDAAGHPVPSRFEPPRYVPSEEDLAVELEVLPGGRWVLDAVVPESVEERADGTALVRLRTDAPAWLARLVVMAGGGVRVTQPPELVAAVVERARSARDGLLAVADGPA